MLEASVNADLSGRAETVLVVNLLEEALTCLDKDSATARRLVGDACALVQRAQDEARARNGMLAGWQVQRAEAYIARHLDTRLRIGLVAKAVNLSPSYFSRAFKATMGLPYSGYLLVSRLARAKRLLLTTDMPIAQIALQCGMADQSHLTRVFTRAVGVPPRAWRSRMLDLRMVGQDDETLA